MTLRVLFIADGESPIVRRWLAHEVAQGHEVWLATIHGDPDVPGVWVIKPPAGNGLTRRLSYTALVAPLRRFVRKHQPDIVHAHYGGGYGMVGSLCGASNLVLSLWGTDVLEAPRTSRMRRAVLTSMLRRSDAICVNSEHLRQAAIQYTRKPVDLTYFGVDPVFFRDHGGERPAGEPLRLTTVKRFDQNSGITTLIKAVALLRDRGIDVHLSAIGSQLDSSGADLVRELNLTDRVVFRGAQATEALADAFAQSDVYVQPTAYTEGFGIAVVEAQAVHLPAVASAVGGLLEAVDPASGVLVPPNDPVALAEALTPFATDRDRLLRARGDARAHAERFHWDTVAPAMDAVYRRLVTGESEEQLRG